MQQLNVTCYDIIGIDKEVRKLLWWSRKHILLTVTFHEGNHLDINWRIRASSPEVFVDTEKLVDKDREMKLNADDAVFRFITDAR